MTYATTFSGIGGWELGLNACGWELQWQCECEPFCQALLRERFGVPVYPDIRTLCEHNPAPVDALIGSPPCQPFSVSGKKNGLSDERHLYPAFVKLVAHLRPRYLLMEQVPNILSIPRAFAGYIGGLVTLGYSVAWHCIPASAIGAAHLRDRLWIVAHSEGKRLHPHSIFKSANAQVRLREQRGITELLADKECRIEAKSSNHRTVDGLPETLDEYRLHAIGNAVIPQIPYLLGQAINQIES